MTGIREEKKDMVPVTYRMPRATKEILQHHAIKAHTSLTAIITEAVREWMEAHQVAQGAANTAS